MAYTIVLLYFVLINSLTFLLMGFDKQRAKRKKRRVPEQRLFLFSAIGGAAGTWLGMKKWRHKTQHRSFTVGIPLLLALNLALIIGFIWLIGMHDKS
ncbi:DUF1294 domain-containing protein [Paenibacillus sp. sgz302251]|uniref:DUF1294 domain-containing protein n=1 Tax=Paenibacillus sp. sgz302251 TaxID=3414493 RepID=UPI003C7A5DE7